MITYSLQFTPSAAALRRLDTRVAHFSGLITLASPISPGRTSTYTNPVMAAEQRKLLEQLMGDTLMGATSSRQTLSITDPKVCRSYIAGTCPHDLYAYQQQPILRPLINQAQGLPTPSKILDRARKCIASLSRPNTTRPMPSKRKDGRLTMITCETCKNILTNAIVRLIPHNGGWRRRQMRYVRRMIL